MPKELLDQAKLIYSVFRKNEKVLLIVLDACNWRVLSALRPHWSIRVVRSRGSNTHEWLERSFVKPLKDAVYISANPYTYVLKDIRKKFKRVVDLCLISWDDKLQTVRPSAVNFFVKENVISGETKIIAHYMQPHAPFLANTWLNIYSHNFARARSLEDFRELRTYDLARKSFDVREEFKKAYVKNLEIVTRYAESLLKYFKENSMDFKTVITSDHSEIISGLYNPLRVRKKIWLWIPWILGIYRFVGHEYNSIFKKLYEVPWIEF